jgi:hypothetical protein
LEKWYPSSLNVGQKSYEINYDLSYRGLSITIQIPEQDLKFLAQNDFEQPLFRNQPFMFSIFKEGGSTASTDNLDTYKEKVKADRLQRKRDDFEQSMASQLKTHPFSSRDGQREIQEKLFDAETQRYAYL